MDNSIGVDLIKQEREKQVLKHGFDSKHDLQYTDKELLRAAYTYLRVVLWPDTPWQSTWPWDKEWFKDDGYIENLKKVGALVAAEIDRLQIN